MKQILVTGGCGYIGSVLVNELIKKYKVIVIDTQWFGNKLKKNANLKIIKDDIKNIKKYNLRKINTIIHLANIANDPGVELNPQLSWEVNVLSTQQLVEHAVKYKVKQFIFASSGSVYGVKKEKKVTEDLSLVPISNYNKTKMIAERVLKSYEHKIKIHCIRPATVCGFSPRMRLDVSVNMFAFQAIKSKLITVLGGNQIRPNIHIKDLVNVFLHFISKPNLPNGSYNAGFENLKIIEIAKEVVKIIPAKITIKKGNDPRSYRQNSQKLLSTGFKRKYCVANAIKEIKNMYNNKKFFEDESCYTVKWMKKLKL